MITRLKKYGPINSIVLSRAGGSDNVYLRDEASVTENGLCEIKILDNQIMNFNDRNDYLHDILGRLDGLEYYINDFTSTGITYYNLCDRYTVDIEDREYSCIMFNNEINITQGLEERIYTELPETSETDYSKSDKTDRRINQTYIIVDKQNQRIDQVVTNVTDQNNKISQITQTVDEINSKIQDIADITIAGESAYASLELNDVNQSQPIMVKIRPITTNISYLYPRNNLYPEDTLFMPTRTLRFTNKEEYELTTDSKYLSGKSYFTHDAVTDEYILLIAGTDYNVGDNIVGDIYQNKNYDYELPDDLLWYDNTHYDEFYLDYDSQTCQVTKRCKYNADGTVSLLDNERVDTYPYPTLLLEDGDYVISLLNYSTGYIFVRLMAKNMYTTQFATKAELNSSINQTASEINARVALKLDEQEFTHASIVLKINDNTSSALIEADKIDLNATKIINLIAGNTINLTSKNIAITSNNFRVTTAGAMTCSNATITGGSLRVGSNFNVTTTGNLTARNANITGTINANAGTIGGCTISGGTLQIANANIDSLNVSKLTTGTNTQALKFTNVEATGKITATSGSFSGSLYSSSGTIGGWSLSGSDMFGTGSGSIRMSTSAITLYNSATTFAYWTNVIRAANNVSDKRKKINVKSFDDTYEKFYNNLKPVTFNFKKDQGPDEKLHLGFIVQDILENQNKSNIEELGMIWDSHGTYHLDKEEIIALNTWQIQKLKQRVEELEKKLEEK